MAANVRPFGMVTQSPPPSPCSLHGFLNSQSRYVKAKHNFFFFLPSEFFIDLKLE